MLLVFFIAFYLLLNLLIGFWASKRIQNSEDFILAGRSLSLPVAGTTIFATWFGSETIMSSSVEFAEGGILAVIKDPFGAALCLLLIGFFFAGPLYRMKIVTLSDFFKIRYNKKVEIVSVLLLSFSYLSWIAAQMIAMGTIISVLTIQAGFPLSVSFATIFGASLVTIYTMIGGMWAVSMTDFLQSIVIILGLIILTLILALDLGAWHVLSSQPDGFFSFLPATDNESIFSYGEAWIIVGLGSIPSQDVFQRTLAAKNEKTAIRSAYLAAGLYLSVALLPLFLGLCGKLLFPELLNDSDEAKQMLLPTLVLTQSPIWLQIIFFGALISAVMSTTSGAILAPASIITKNLIKSVYPNLNDRNLLYLLRTSVVCISALSLWQALGGDSIYNLAADSSAMSLVTLFFPMLMGLYWKKTTSTAALASMLSGFAVWMSFDFLFPKAVLPSIFPASTISLVVLIFLSYLTKNRPSGSE